MRAVVSTTAPGWQPGMEVSHPPAGIASTPRAAITAALAFDGSGSEGASVDVATNADVADSSGDERVTILGRATTAGGGAANTVEANDASGIVTAAATAAASDGSCGIVGG